MIHVGDDYRTNPLSLQPGGHEITLVYEVLQTKRSRSFLKSLTYDKVKNPHAYIKRISKKEDPLEILKEVWVDGNCKWKKDSGSRPWEF